VKALSGGNQQKVLLARALINQPQILLLDEPTRGIDVGAKQDVYRWIRHTAAAGTVVIVSSLEEAELIGLADRILVLRDGRQVAIVEGPDATEHRLLALASGAKLY
jgi:ABC-type sugar transport system ATPase subunit